jgi:hypothetical protein
MYHMTGHPFYREQTAIKNKILSSQLGPGNETSSDDIFIQLTLAFQLSVPTELQRLEDLQQSCGDSSRGIRPGFSQNLRECVGRKQNYNIGW